MKPILIIGSSSYGRLIARLVEHSGRKVAGFIDDFNVNGDALGTRADLSDKFSPDENDLALAVGYKHFPERIKIYTEATNLGYHFPPIIHPAAYVANDIDIGNGCILMAGANVDSFAAIGQLCVLWPGVIVSHDCQIGENTFISPNATLCGFVRVGPSSFIGAGSTIVDGCWLPEASFVKAGSLYTSERSTI